MNYKVVKQIKLPQVYRCTMLLNETIRSSVLKHRHQIKSILKNEDSRFILIIGPCSAWPSQAVLNYAKRLKTLIDEYEQILKIVLRVYIHKPRSSVGWAGPVSQPDLFASPDFEAGLVYCSEMLTQIAPLDIPIASELLFPHHQENFLDLLSWAAIGARSSENPEHRILASRLNLPVGLKNPTNGAVEAGINSVVAAQSEHDCILDQYHVRTLGNEWAHLVLRGGINSPNYSLQHLNLVYEKMRLQNVKHPAVLIDASHDNCLLNGIKQYQTQPNIIYGIIENLFVNPHLQSVVKGFMVESFIERGNQSIESQSLNLNGLSITDPCLGWDETEEFIHRFSQLLVKNHLSPNAVKQKKRFKKVGCIQSL